MISQKHNYCFFIAFVMVGVVFLRFQNPDTLSYPFQWLDIWSSFNKLQI
jgi:hypothetical protein